MYNFFKIKHTIRNDSRTKRQQIKNKKKQPQRKNSCTIKTTTHMQARNVKTSQQRSRSDRN